MIAAGVLSDLFVWAFVFAPVFAWWAFGPRDRGDQ